MPAYDGTDNLNQWNSAQPNDSVEPVKNLGPAVREIKRVVEEVIEKEHNSDGTHAVVNGIALVDASVATAKLADGAITVDKLATGAVTADKIAAGAVAVAGIADGTITGAKLAAQTVAATNLLGSAIAGQILISDGSNNMVLATISGDVSLAADGTTTVAIASSLAVTEFAQIMTTGVAGGTLTTGVWTQRPFNSTQGDTSGGGVVLSSNQFTVVKPGLYLIETECIGGPGVGLHQIKLVDVTTSGSPVDKAFGSNGESVASATSTSRFSIVLTCAANTIYQIQHRCATTVATNGMGAPNSFGGSEVYGSIRFIRLA